MKKVYATEADAKTAAEAQAKRDKRGAFTFDYDVAVADPSITPNAKASLSGWDSEIDGIKWLEMSTSGGNVEAYLILGLVYQEGISVQKDAGKAVTNLTLAAELGEPRAMSRLAGIYFKGDLAPQNDVLAVKWAVCAAELGNKSVLKNLEQLNKDVEARSKVLGKQAAEAWLKRRFPKSKP